MAVYVAFLRAVNVGGHNKVSMTGLRETFLNLGFTGVSTYLNSGNVVFAYDGDKFELFKVIENEIAKEVGVGCEVIVRSAQELQTVIRASPFGDRQFDPKTLYVTFLRASFTGFNECQVDPALFLPDRFAIQEDRIYLHCPEGYGSSKLTNTFWERRCGSPATTRNWNTVTKLAQMSSDLTS